jgi:drug/metabolite transporter (DMT)-like permease
MSKNGYVLATIGGIVLSFDTVFIKAINFSPERMAFWRSVSMSLPAILILIYQLLFSSKSYQKINITNKYFILSSIFYGLSSILFPVSVMLTSISNMLFIISTAPLWAAVISRIFTKESINLSTLMCFVISMLGVITVMLGSSTGLTLSIGDLTAFATAICMASAFVVGRKSNINVSLSPSFGSIVAAIFLYFYFNLDFHVASDKLILILLEGAVVMFIALSLLSKASSIIPSVHLGFFLLLETVFGPIWIWMTFGEIPPIYTVIGGFIILVGLLTNSFLAMRMQRA